MPNDELTAKWVEGFHQHGGELRSCPFCGGDANVFRDHANDYYVTCANQATGCNVDSRTWAQEDLETAIVMWNQRPDDARVANLEAMRDGLFNENKALYRTILDLQKQLDGKKPAKVRH